VTRYRAEDADASQHLPARRERPTAGLRGSGQVRGRPALARPDPILRALPRRHLGRPPGQTTRRAALAASRVSWTSSGA
jgi:hypothetical protein